MPHIVLLGDSIFDNRAYTGREPDVITHLQDVLPDSWHATLVAIDGAATRGLPSQSEPSDYANPIEPSGQGGLKIARAVARAAGAIPGDAGTKVFM